MEKANSVYLNGTVGDCVILRREGDVTVAGVTFYTLLPKPGADPKAPPSDRYEYMRHLVRVRADGGDGDSLVDLARSCRERASLHPYELRGVLRYAGSNSVVDVAGRDFIPTRSIGLKGNNVAFVAGSVSSVSYSDAYAVVVLDTGGGNVTAFFPKATFKDAWKAVSAGRLRKGSGVEMRGPLLGCSYTDGRKTFFRSVVTPHVINQRKLSRDNTRGPGRGR